MYAFFCSACWHLGWVIAVLLLASNWSLGCAVDKRRRMAASRNTGLATDYCDGHDHKV